MQFNVIRFDPNEALKAGLSGSNYFEGNSEQRVTITRAEFVYSEKTGAQGVEFDVENEQGERGYFTIWHFKGNGEANTYSYRLLQSLAGICRAQTLTPQSVKVPKYDKTQNQIVMTNCINAAELLGKHFIGLFMSIYSYYNGEERHKMELFGAFNESRQSYREQNAGVVAQDIEDAKAAMLKKSAKSKQDMEAQKQRYQRYQQPSENNAYAQASGRTTYYGQQQAQSQYPQASHAPPSAHNQGFVVDDDNLPF